MILNHPKLEGLALSLCRVEHLIILAWRLIGVGLDLLQVPDNIRLMPGITRHLKQLSLGKADHTDCSTIIFLLLSLPILTVSHTCRVLTGTDVLCMVRGRFAVSYRVKTKHLWNVSIFGLLMDLLPFSYGAGLVEWCSPVLNLITGSPAGPLHCF